MKIDRNEMSTYEKKNMRNGIYWLELNQTKVEIHTVLHDLDLIHWHPSNHIILVVI